MTCRTAAMTAEYGFDCRACWKLAGWVEPPGRGLCPAHQGQQWAQCPINVRQSLLRSIVQGLVWRLEDAAQKWG